MPYLFLANRVPAKTWLKEKIATTNKKILLVIIDMGIAVKKIASMLQKYVLPERT